MGVKMTHRLQLRRPIGEQPRGDEGVGRFDDRKVGIDLQRYTFEHPEASDNGDVEGGQRESILVHDVAQLVDDGFEIELGDGSVEHVGQGGLEGGGDGGGLDFGGNETETLVEGGEGVEVPVYDVDYGLDDAIPGDGGLGG